MSDTSDEFGRDFVHEPPSNLEILAELRGIKSRLGLIAALLGLPVLVAIAELLTVLFYEPGGLRALLYGG